MLVVERERALDERRRQPHKVLQSTSATSAVTGKDPRKRPEPERSGHGTMAQHLQQRDEVAAHMQQSRVDRIGEHEPEGRTAARARVVCGAVMASWYTLHVACGMLQRAACCLHDFVWSMHAVCCCRTLQKSGLCIDAPMHRKPFLRVFSLLTTSLILPAARCLAFVRCIAQAARCVLDGAYILDVAASSARCWP